MSGGVHIVALADGAEIAEPANAQEIACASASIDLDTLFDAIGTG